MSVPRIKRQDLGVLVIDDAIAIRPLAYASFTFDHRILDGAKADAFMSNVKEKIESWS